MGEAALRRWVPIVIVTAVCLGLVLAIVAGTGWLLSSVRAQPGPPPDAAATYVLNSIPRDRGDEPVVTYGEIEDPYVNPFTHTQQPADVSEDMARRYILGMAKQKIHADLKTSFYELTPERLDWLLETIGLHDEYADQELYIDILTRWQAGDFSRAVEDHNAVWERLDGDIGRAIRLATPEEEAAYLEFKRE